MQSIKQSLGINGGEGALLSTLIVLSFFFGTANIFVETAAFSLFLSEYPAQDLPYVYLIVAVVVSSLAYGYLRLGRRLPFSRLLVVNISFLAGLALVFQFGLVSALSRQVKFILPLLFQIQVNFVNLAFWGLLGQIFSVQQAKRLFGLAGSGLWIGIITMGFLMPTLITWVGLTQLLWLAAGSLLFGLAALIVILRNYGAKLSVSPQGAEPEQTSDSKPGLARSRYVLLIFGLIVIWWVVFFFVDVLYYDRVTARFSSLEEMAGFIGVYLAFVGIFTWVVNTFVSAWFFKRFGQQKALLLLPVLLTLLAGVLFITSSIPGAAAGLFFIMVAVKMLDVSLGFSLDRSALTLLYQPLVESARRQIQTVAEGIVQPLAIGLAGLMLLLLSRVLNLSLQWMYLIFLVLAGIWVGVALVLGREYIKMLFAAIDRRIFGKHPVDLIDRTAVEYLVGALNSPFSGTVLYAMHTLGELDYADYPALMLKMTHHEAEVIRANALQRIEAENLDLALERMRDMARQEPQLKLRGQALITLAKLGNEQDNHEIAAFLNDESDVLRQGALAGLLKYCQGPSHQVARERVTSLAESALELDRVHAAEAVPWIEPADQQLILLPLLRDPHLNVQRAALQAAGRVQPEKPILMKVLHLSGQGGLAGAATAALVRIGAASPGLVHAAFDEALSEDQPAQLKVLARVLGRLSGPESIEALKQTMLHPALSVRAAALEGLGRRSWQSDSIEDRNHIEAYFDLELNFAAWCQSAQSELASTLSTAFLRNYLERHARQAIQRATTGLAFCYSEDVIAVLSSLLDNPETSDNDRAFALEFIDLEFSTRHAEFLSAILSNDRGQVLLPGQSERSGAEPVSWAERYTQFGNMALPLGQALILSLEADLGIAPISEQANDALALSASSNPRETLPMQSTIEKLLILKSVKLFESTADDVLAEIAALLQEVHVNAGETLFEKGDFGDCMYVVVSGQLHVHDGSQVISKLSERESFGEIAMLDAGNRVASVIAQQDSLLLRLDQGPFYELMEQQIDIVRAIIQQLTRYVRSNVSEVERMHEMFGDQLTTTNRDQASV
jgi:hypothetical protein